MTNIVGRLITSSRWLWRDPSPDDITRDAAGGRPGCREGARKKFDGSGKARALPHFPIVMQAATTPYSRMQTEPYINDTLADTMNESEVPFVVHGLIEEMGGDVVSDVSYAAMQTIANAARHGTVTVSNVRDAIHLARWTNRGTVDARDVKLAMRVGGVDPGPL